MEFEDDDFLYQVAEAEALALAAKRRKLTTVVSTTTSSSTSSSQPETNTTEQTTPEGPYTAALRGSRSQSFQQLSSITNGPIKSFVAGSNNALANGEHGGSGGVGGSCFKCGKSGHWARDCVVESYASDPSVPEKACPCGLGVCAVRTANTDKNRGRKFYKCPQREDNGGCGFFEWCDKNNGNDMSMRSQGYVSCPSVPGISCPCGAGSCLILTAKTGKNIGQQFYRCPASQENSCGFFKWCHDQQNADKLSASVNPKLYNNEMNKRSSGTSGSSCFKCGMEGHWAKDCQVPSNQNPVGHDQKNTVQFSTMNKRNSDMNNDMNKRNSGAGASGFSCFKCGKEGHWAKDCQLSSNQIPVGHGRSFAPSGSCYKCGNPGHWANNCSSG